jgi:carbonic anhydrase
MTDHDAFDDLITANERQADTIPGSFGGAELKLVVVTCMDSRIDPLSHLGLSPTQALILRNAGARVTDDVERSVAVATAVLGSDRVAVIAHTGCKMAAATEDEVAGLVAQATGTDAADLAGRDFGTIADLDTSVAEDVDRLRRSAVVPDETKIAGFVLDLASGRLRGVS